jgi:hypothetical protein
VTNPERAEEEQQAQPIKRIAPRNARLPRDNGSRLRISALENAGDQAAERSLELRVQRYATLSPEERARLHAELQADREQVQTELLQEELAEEQREERESAELDQRLAKVQAPEYRTESESRALRIQKHEQLARDRQAVREAERDQGLQGQGQDYGS